MFSTQFFTLNYLIMWRDHFKEFLKMRFQVLTLCQSEQRTWFYVICVYQKEDLHWWCKHGNMNNTRINSWNKSTHWHSWTVNISHVLLLIFLNKSNFRNLFGFCNFLNFPLTLEFNFHYFCREGSRQNGNYLKKQASTLTKFQTQQVVNLDTEPRVHQQERCKNSKDS